MFAAVHATELDAEKLLKLAQEFSPWVERTTADTVAFDADGLEHIYGLPQEIAAALMRRVTECGFQAGAAGVAIAANLDAAVHAARGFAGVSVIPHGDEAKFLGSLPIALLEPTPEMQETLDRWGIWRFRDLAALPEWGVAERLGSEGLRLHRQACGAGGRRLVPLGEPLHFEEECELEYPVEILEPLAFVLERLLQSMCARLLSRGLAIAGLRLRLQLENRQEYARALRFPVPMLDAGVFLKLLRLDLSAHPPPAPVVRLWLEGEPAKPRPAQSGLFIPIAPEPEKLELTLARLKSLVGDENVGSPALLDTHRPGAFRMADGALSPSTRPCPVAPYCASLSLRTLRPARPARVQMAAGQPVQVQAEGIRGHVVSSAGPWRTSGDWWTSDPWARDAWDVALSDGALYRIYCEQGGWFVEGSYD